MCTSGNWSSSPEDEAATGHPDEDPLAAYHLAWLKEHYDAGRFLVSGRRIPRTGGVIVARGDDQEEIEALAASDPFVRGGVATCEVIHFRASQSASRLDALL